MAQIVETKIEIAGKEIKQFLQLSLIQVLDWHHQFELQFPPEAFIEDEKESSEAISLEKFKSYFGEKILINLRQIEKKKNTDKGEIITESLFKGIITNIKVSKEFGTSHEIIFQGNSDTLFVEDGNICRSFENSNLKKIVNEVLKPFSDLESNISPQNSSTLPYFVQYKESNFHFLHRLAALFGEWCYYDGEALQFGKFSNGSEETLKLGDNLSHFEMVMCLSPANFGFSSYNYLENQHHKNDSSSMKVDGLDNYGDQALSVSEKTFKEKTFIPSYYYLENQSYLDKFLKTNKSAYASKVVVFRGSSKNPGLKIGTKIKIKSGPRDIGTYLITKINHASTQNGSYQNSFEAISQGLQSPLPNPNVNLPYCEPELGIVKENNDPEKLGRVRVQLHWQKKGQLSPWIRMTQLYSGEARGYYFIPEIGDEVLVAYEYGNPNRPYVIGSMYHGNAKPDIHSGENLVKGIITKGGNRIIMIDGDEGKIRIHNKDEKNEITLALEEEGKILIKSEGKLEMEAETIEMKAKNISLKADEGLDMDGKETQIVADNVKVEAKQNSEIKGMNIKLEAKTNAELKSNAKVSVEGSAATEIKGGIIKLN